jgi:hypothetical protein
VYAFGHHIETSKSLMLNRTVPILFCWQRAWRRYILAGNSLRNDILLRLWITLWIVRLKDVHGFVHDFKRHGAQEVLLAFTSEHKSGEVFTPESSKAAQC